MRLAGLTQRRWAMGRVESPSDVVSDAPFRRPRPSRESADAGRTPSSQATPGSISADFVAIARIRKSLRASRAAVLLGSARSDLPPDWELPGSGAGAWPGRHARHCSWSRGVRRRALGVRHARQALPRGARAPLRIPEGVAAAPSHVGVVRDLDRFRGPGRRLGAVRFIRPLPLASHRIGRGVSAASHPVRHRRFLRRAGATQ